MSRYFDNPNRLRLNQRQSKLGNLGYEPGVFIASNGEDHTPLGSSINMTVMDIRPVVVLFSGEGQEPTVYHDPDSVEYNSAMDFVRAAELFGGPNTIGCFGYELAVKVNGKKYIFPCCTKMTRSLLPTFEANLNVAIRVDSEKVETRHFSWYRMEVWVRASQVASYKREHYSDYDAGEDFS